MVFRAELRTGGVTDRAGLVLRATEGPPRADHSDGRAARDEVTGDHGWASHEVTMEITGDTHTISFGVALHGPGQVELRHPELLRHR